MRIPGVLAKNRHPSPRQVHRLRISRSRSCNKHPQCRQEVKNHPPPPPPPQAGLLEPLADAWTGPRDQHLWVLSDFVTVFTLVHMCRRGCEPPSQTRVLKPRVQKHHLRFVLRAHPQAHSLQEADSRDLRLRPGIRICHESPCGSDAGPQSVRLPGWDNSGFHCWLPWHFKILRCLSVPRAVGSERAETFL